MGFISAEQLHRLHEAGVTSYHHNIETSRRNFPEYLYHTHLRHERSRPSKNVKAEGMCACSGGIIGMGETWEDRLDMAISLAELGIDSIPINTLMPIPGTPLEHLPELSEPDILRTIAFFRYINPGGKHPSRCRTRTSHQRRRNCFQSRSFRFHHRKHADHRCMCDDPKRPQDAH